MLPAVSTAIPYANVGPLPPAGGIEKTNPVPPGFNSATKSMPAIYALPWASTAIQFSELSPANVEYTICPPLLSLVTKPAPLWLLGIICCRTPGVVGKSAERVVPAMYAAQLASTTTAFGTSIILPPRYVEYVNRFPEAAILATNPFSPNPKVLRYFA